MSVYSEDRDIARGALNSCVYAMGSSELFALVRGKSSPHFVWALVIITCNHLWS